LKHYACTRLKVHQRRDAVEGDWNLEQEEWRGHDTSSSGTYIYRMRVPVISPSDIFRWNSSEIYGQKLSRAKF
jgi:hypothetical protein